MERFKIIPACYLALIKEGKILLLRRYKTGYEDGNYSMIAGHLDGNETFRQAMAREAMEEANIVINLDDLKIVHAMHRSREDIDGERIDLFLAANEWIGNIVNAEPEKCDDLRWFSLDELPDNIIPFVRQAIDCINNKVYYSEFGF